MAITLDEKPVFMIGVERSGTTLVMAMLGCHPRFAVPEVDRYYSRFRPYLHTYGDLANGENFRTLPSEMVLGLKTPFWGMDVNVRTIVDEIISEVRERSFAGIYCAMIERFPREVGGKPRWGEKTPYNLFFIKEILEDFPNANSSTSLATGGTRVSTTLNPPSARPISFAPRISGASARTS